MGMYYPEHREIIILIFISLIYPASKKCSDFNVYHEQSMAKNCLVYFYSISFKIYFRDLLKIIKDRIIKT